jgi:hypothetical protein
LFFAFVLLSLGWAGNLGIAYFEKQIVKIDPKKKCNAGIVKMA